ncbi:MAG: cytochrome c peroxidase [Parvibaculum sp.]|uniref:cytochrome c peroxidase n=1 Tax=Parvibaculum sp. TaxID=2024848 RepID=UPI00284C3636|nr:cytochrome c peroxidase [Parvibaculum sp.]MDR3500225.1 cytochrome c peroxidase [Parvibaculum sp.]
MRAGSGFVRSTFAIAFAAGALLAASHAWSFPIKGTEGILPADTELGEDVGLQPRELFRSDVNGGKHSYLVNLGDMAFSSPGIFGGPARQAGMSCESCHINGAGNAKLFVPGMSTRHGNFDTTGPLFNPKADNGVLDPLTPPSLRGARFLAPYGHDGRLASLRDFVRNVVVNEFAGAEPTPEILDGLVAYIQDIDFLPNPRISPDGRLKGKATAEELRGQALFNKPFPHDPGMSCSGCHIPSGAFVDHKQHDVGTGLFKTPTLLNANFNAPYFHDGRYDTYDQVVGYFDKTFDLKLNAQDRRALVAYLNAVGDGEEPMQADSIDAELDEIANFSSTFDISLPEKNMTVISLAVDTIGTELRELQEQFPERKDRTVKGGIEERRTARAHISDMVLALRRIETAASQGKFEEARAEYGAFKQLAAEARPKLAAAEPWSLFNPPVREAHFAALRELTTVADGGSVTPR